jgi:SAM-dependent methyltransferase
LPLRIKREEIQNLGSKPIIEEPDPEAFYNPSKWAQERFVGVSFETAYEQASWFLDYFMQHCVGEAAPERILDFGCGWGRMLRLLRRVPELEAVEMHGCDPQEEILETVRRTVPGVWVTPSRAYPPSLYNSGAFDCIYAFSVFSHLAEDCHMAWAEEFARILKPGGSVCLTTQGLKFLGNCRDYREGKTPITHPWHQELAKSFAEPDSESRYLAGDFLFSGTQPDNPSYGEAVVPKSYFESRWGGFGFELVDWDETYGQNWCVLRRSS